MSDWTRDGFSEKDFQKWCRCVLRFLRMFPSNPRDLILKDSIKKSHHVRS